VYGAVAGLGLTVVSRALVAHQGWLRVGGGLFLCYLGARTLLAAPATRAAAVAGRSRLAAFASTFALTLTNPATILSFVAVFAGLGVAAGGLAGAGMVVAGVFLGSALWWLVLSGGVGFFRARVTPGALRWVNRLSGTVLLAFGLLALLLPG
jgi:threonine/homoserine/homoserine lactone efflux protein